jgi:HIV Tat-specific factor 1
VFSLQTPAAPIARRLAKRTAAEAEIDYTGASGPSKASKPESKEKQGRERGPKQTTAVFVSGLPLDASVEEIAAVFERYGVLAEADDGKPRVRIYEDEQGRPKGEALVTYFKAESVELAVAVLDESCLRAAQGQQAPVMHVSKAQWKAEKGKKKEKEEEKKPKEKRTEQEKKEAKRRFEKLNG